MSLFGCDHGQLIADLRAALAQRDADLEWLRNWMLGERKFFEDQAIAQQERYDALVRASLRPQGINMPDINPELAKFPAAPAPKPDALKALIHALAPDDTRKRAMMLRQLAVDRAGGMGEEQIEQAIRDGIPSDGVPS